MGSRSTEKAIRHGARLALTLLLLAGLVGCDAGAEEKPGREAPPSSPRTPAAETPAPAATAGSLLPDLATTEPDEIYIERDDDGARLLRFSTTVENRGAGRLELIGEEDEDGSRVALQVIERQDGETTTRVAGPMVMSEEHGHWHLDDFALYQLWPLEPSEGAGGPAAVQNKTSFCLVDEARIRDAQRVAEEPEFLACDWERQGISEGWSETYVAALPQQWVEITGVPDGRYVLRVTLDPDGMLAEQDDGNNGVAVQIEISGDDVRQLPPP